VNEVATVVKAIWLTAGPLVGVFIGAYIPNRNQKQQWISTCKKEEYSELISVLTKSMMTYIDHSAYLIAKGPAEQREEAEALARVGETSRNRIFIFSAVRELQVVERWHNATRFIESGGNLNEFAKIIGKLLDDIRAHALKDMGA
jgi:hypothetical protein